MNAWQGFDEAFQVQGRKSREFGTDLFSRSDDDPFDFWVMFAVEFTAWFYCIIVHGSMVLIGPNVGRYEMGLWGVSWGVAKDLIYQTMICCCRR